LGNSYQDSEIDGLPPKENPIIRKRKVKDKLFPNLPPILVQVSIIKWIPKFSWNRYQSYASAASHSIKREKRKEKKKKRVNQMKSGSLTQAEIPVNDILHRPLVLFLCPLIHPRGPRLISDICAPLLCRLVLLCIVYPKGRRRYSFGFPPFPTVTSAPSVL
jgi:hypothetical protein